MTLTRRLAAGLPAVGVTALAAMAFAGTPAGATTSENAVHAVLTTPCPAGATCADGYGNSTVGPAATADEDDGRGKPGYGGQSPTPTPSPSTPTRTNTVPPGGVSPTTSTPTGQVNTVPPGGVSPTTAGPGGVSGGTLAVTGAPVATTITLGAVLVAGGGAAIWYTRRRRVS